MEPFPDTQRPWSIHDGPRAIVKPPRTIDEVTKDLLAVQTMRKTAERAWNSDRPGWADWLARLADIREQKLIEEANAINPHWHRRVLPKDFS
jgi:hypothetical protein